MILSRLLGRGTGVPPLEWYVDAETFGGTVGCERLLCVVPHADPAAGCGYMVIEFPDTGKPRLGEWIARAEEGYPSLIGARRVSERFVQANVPGLYGLLGRLRRG